MSGFALPAGEDLDLVLSESWTAAPLHALILANLDHLRPWEDQARADLTLEEFAAGLRTARLEWAEGRGVPCALRFRGRLVGALGARTTPALARAELGYWIDAEHQGRGLVTRAVTAMIEHLVVERQVQRVEIRAAAENLRSRAVAERLGFELEGTLRAVLPIEGRRHDVCVYGLLPSPG